MKKILSLIMAILMAFSVFTVAVSAEEATETPAIPAVCTHKRPDGSWAGDRVITLDATCTEKGVILLECTICGDDVTTLFGPYEHSYGETITVEASCATEGYTAKACTKCDLVEKTNVIPAKPHTYGDWAEALAPTCIAAGSKERICSVCNTVEKAAVAALGHNYVATVVAPDYDKEGYTLHKCSRCTEQYSDNFTAKLTGKVAKLELGEAIRVNAKDTVAIDLSGLVIYGNVKIVSTTYKSSDEKVATVDDKGIITGKGLGNAEITCKITDEYGNTVEDTVKVSVNFSILDWITFIASLLMSAITIVLGGLDFSSLGQLFEGLIPKE